MNMVSGEIEDSYPLLVPPILFNSLISPTTFSCYSTAGVQLTFVGNNFFNYFLQGKVIHKKTWHTQHTNTHSLEFTQLAGRKTNLD